MKDDTRYKAGDVRNRVKKPPRKGEMDIDETTLEEEEKAMVDIEQKRQKTHGILKSEFTDETQERVIDPSSSGILKGEYEADKDMEDA